MGSLVINNAVRYSGLTPLLQDAAGSPVAGPFFGAKVHLFTNDYNPDAAEDLSVYTEATFTGYTASSVTWNAPYLDGDGLGHVDGADVTSAASAAPTAPETVHGWYLTNSGSTTLLAAQRLNSPIVIAAIHDGLTVTPYFTLPF